MTVAEALVIDKETSTTVWHDAIKKEMKNVMIAFFFVILMLSLWFQMDKMPHDIRSELRTHFVLEIQRQQ
jgi:hypothetical protein